LTKESSRNIIINCKSFVEEDILMSDAVKSLSADSFDQTVKSQSLVLVDFWATWCGPCKIIGPVIEELAKEYAGKVTFAKVNTDENPDLASRHNIRGIPTLIFFKDGKILDQVVGAVPKAQLKSKIESLI